MKYIVLDKDAFCAEYHKAFEKVNVQTEGEKDAFRKQVFSVQGAVEDALKQKWKVPDDFQVGWDFNYCYHTCGGVYSERIFCPDYIETIGSAIESVDPEGRWTYHTACEIEVNPAGKTIGECVENRGEFFIRGNACYINGSEMKRDWRARLGCPD